MRAWQGDAGPGLYCGLRIRLSVLRLSVTHMFYAWEGKKKVAGNRLLLCIIGGGGGSILRSFSPGGLFFVALSGGCMRAVIMGEKTCL